MLFLTQIDSNSVASLFADFLSQRFDTFLVGFLAGSAETSVSAGTLKPGYHTIHARRPFLNGLRSVTKTLDWPQDRDESCMDYQSGWGRVAGGIITI
jgi:hypothetical protein